MGIVVIIIIGIGVLAGISSIILDGAPSNTISFSPLLCMFVLGAIMIVIIMLILARAQQDHSNDDGNGGIEFIYEPDRPLPPDRYPQLPSEGDEIIDVKFEDVPKYISVRDRKLKYLETTKETEKVFQPDRKKIKR